MLYVKILL